MKRILSFIIVNLILVVWGLSGFAQNFLIDTSRVFFSEPRYQTNASIAFDGTNYLAVWSDQRVIGTADVFGCRVTPDGGILDPTGLIINNFGGTQSEPSIIWDGSQYFLVWRDDRNGRDDVYGARVSSSGVVLDPDGILISDATGDKWGQDVAFDGTNYLAVWVDYRNGGQDIYGARVSQGGVLLDPNGIALCTEPFDQEPPHIAFGNSDYLVVWEDYRSGIGDGDFYGTRVSPAGVVLDPNGIPVCNNADDQIFGDVAFDGTNWLAVFYNYGAEALIYGARVNSAGQVLDTNGFQISPNGSDPSFSAVTFDGTNYLVVWQQDPGGYDDIRAARVSPSGVVLDPSGIDVCMAADDQKVPAVAAGSGEFMAVWQDQRESFYPDIYSARISSAGTVLDPDGFELGLTCNKQTFPDVAFDGTNYLAVWEDNRLHPDTSKVFAMRISANGAALDVAPLAVCNAGGNQKDPSVVFDGLNYLVIWSDWRNGSANTDVYGARLSPSGAVLDPNGIPIAVNVSSEYYPAAVSDGTQSLAVWSLRVGNDYHIYAARISRQGVVLDPNGIAVSAESKLQFQPEAAFGDSVFLIAWEKESNGSNPMDIYAARMKSDGTVLDPGGIGVSTVYNKNQNAPVVGFDGKDFVIAWVDSRYDHINTDIFASRMRQDGTVLLPGGMPVCTESGKQDAPEVLYDDTTAVIIWSDRRTGESDLLAARFDTAGTIIDTFLFCGGTGDQLNAAAAKANGREYLTVYEGWTEEVNEIRFNSIRAWGKLSGVITGIVDDEPTGVLNFQLFQNYPNPFNPTTTIGWHSPVGDWQTLKVYDILGREIATLVNEQKPAGEYQVRWDASGFPSGFYFYQLTAGSIIQTKKMLLLK